jgi:cbb3-type cytochrome oxidase subunit 3
LNQKLGRTFNKGGVFFSLSLIQHIMIPALLGGFLSAILMAINQTSYNGSSDLGTLTGKGASSNGAIQLLGMAFSIGIGLLAGIFIGIFYRIFNNNKRRDQFNDAANFILDDGEKPHDYKEEVPANV